MECDAWVLGLRLHGVSMCLHEPGLEILLEGARFQPKDEKWLGGAYLISRSVLGPGGQRVRVGGRK